MNNGINSYNDSMNMLMKLLLPVNPVAPGPLNGILEKEKRRRSEPII